VQRWRRETTEKQLKATRSIVDLHVEIQKNSQVTASGKRQGNSQQTAGEGARFKETAR
jgi:hypothetical protein